MRIYYAGTLPLGIKKAEKEQKEAYTQSTGFLRTSRSLSSLESGAGECMYFQPAVRGNDIKIL